MNPYQEYLKKENASLIRRVEQLEIELERAGGKVPVWPRLPLAVDFDGVIHSYNSPWKNYWDIPDPPVEGSFDWLREMVQHFEIYIFSLRCLHEDAIFAMKNWFTRWNGEDIIPHLIFTGIKPWAGLYIDDRGYQFTGKNFPTVEEIKSFKPWNKT